MKTASRADYALSAVDIAQLIAFRLGPKKGDARPLGIGVDRKDQKAE